MFIFSFPGTQSAHSGQTVRCVSDASQLTQDTGTMYNVYCTLSITLHVAQCTMYNVYCTLLITLHIAQCTMYNVYCKLSNGQWTMSITMHNVHCTLHWHCTMHIAQCTALHSPHCTVHNTRCTMNWNTICFKNLKSIACSPPYYILIEMFPFDAICINPSAVFFTAAVVTYTSDNCLFSLCLWGGRWHGYEDWCPFTGKGIWGYGIYMDRWQAI